MAVLHQFAEAFTYNPHQPRDKNGRWGSVGISISRGPKASAKEHASDSNLVDMGGHKITPFEIDQISPKATKVILGAIHGIPGMEKTKTLREAVDKVNERLDSTAETALAHGFSVDKAIASSHWYDVANHYTTKLATKLGYTHPETAAAVMAALSPSAAWESNVRNGEQVLKYVSENPSIGSKHVDYMHQRLINAAESQVQQLKSPTSKKNKGKSPEQMEIDRAAANAALEKAKSPEVRSAIEQRVAGKKFNDLPPEDAVLIINGTIQSHAMKGISLIPHKDGSYDEVAHSGKTVVQSEVNVMKALKIAQADKNGANEEQMSKMISENVSSESKVRAFFMNIAHPNDVVQRAATMDTHAFGSLTGVPQAATSPVTKELFKSSKEVGFSNGYPVFRQAMEETGVRLGKRLGLDRPLTARETQSVLWEMERHIAEPKGKGNFLKNKAQMAELHAMLRAGKVKESKEFIYNGTRGGAKS